MERIELNEESLEKVSGGSILFSPDHTTVGRNCNNQAKVNDYAACMAFLKENLHKMDEKQLMREMAARGYITRL